MTMLAPLVAVADELEPDELLRYSRHLTLPGIGVEGQRRLKNARVLVVGAGGLGSPALLYLAAAGVGTLGIVDDDLVEASNLQRQVIHGTSDVGRSKVASARDAIAETNPHVRVVTHQHRLDASNALDILAGYDVVLDGADNFPTRYLVSDAAEVLGIPCVWGSLFQFQGQVSIFWGAPRGLDVGSDAAPVAGVTYRDVFPEPPPPGTVPDCATGGVLGAMCATVGSVMATETLKLITGVGQTLLGRLAVYDALDVSWRQLTVRRDPQREPVTALLAGAADYEAFCGLGPAPSSGVSDAAAATALSVVTPPALTMTVQELAELLDARSRGAAEIELLDVREEWEHSIVAVEGANLVPSGTFFGSGAQTALADLPTDRPVAVLCKAGPRAQRVVAAARAAGIDARTVDGGILAWVREIEPAKPSY